MPILPHDDILKLRAAIISAAMSNDRDALLAGIDPGFVAGLQAAGSSGSQLVMDLDVMNAAGALEDGSVPLIRWLQNAVALVGKRQEAAAFRTALERGRAAASAYGGTALSPSGTSASHQVPQQLTVNISGSTVGAISTAPGGVAIGTVHISSGRSSLAADVSSATMLSQLRDQGRLPKTTLTWTGRNVDDPVGQVRIGLALRNDGQGSLHECSHSLNGVGFSPPSAMPTPPGETFTRNLFLRLPEDAGCVSAVIHFRYTTDWGDKVEDIFEVVFDSANAGAENHGMSVRRNREGKRWLGKAEFGEE